MRMITPFAVTDDILSNSSVPENDHPEWSASKSYAVHDMVIYDHAIYEALDASLNAPPSTDPSLWQKLNTTNRWRAFDQFLANPVEHDGDIEYTLTPPGIAASVVVFRPKGSAVHVVVRDSNQSEIYNVTKTVTDTSNVVDWFTYFFEPTDVVGELLFDNIPPEPSATLTVIIEATSGRAEVGQIIFGADRKLGESEYGISIEIEDYSAINRDDFGLPSVIERDYADNVGFDFIIPISATGRIKRLIAAQRARPSVFYTSAETLSFGTLVYGFGKGLTVNLNNFAESHCTLDVEGLV